MRGATSSTLPPDSRSAGQARRIVTAACREAGLEHLLDEALLVVTELVTNAVVHAGTSLDLLLDTSGPGLRAEVVDRGGGRLPLAADEAGTDREGGRGLFLLDALASAWGTSHTRAGKSVWFLLDAQPAPVDAVEAPAPTSSAGLPPLAELLVVPERVEPVLAPDQLVGELLHRLCEGLRVDDAQVLVVDADGRSDEVARVGAGAPGHRALVERLARSAERAVRAAGLLVLPLSWPGGLRGAVVLGVGEGDGPDRDEQVLARLVADRIAAVLDAEHQRVSRHRTLGALALLAEAGEMFAGSLDVTLTVTLLAQLVVPRFGRWGAVFAVDGGAPRLLSVAHADEAQAASLRLLLSSGGAPAAVADLVDRLDPRRAVLVAETALPGLADLDGDLLVVPLVARRRLLGMLLVGRDGRAADDLGLLEDLGRRAALAMDTARLYEERSEVAQALQASLLPPALPDVPGLQLGARYAAAGAGNEVGGDFYDVFPLPDGRWGVAIGDVCGKGPEAAAITGLARNVLRLLTQDGRSATQVFGRLNDAILELDERGRFCTAALAVLQVAPDGLRVQLSSAGHPPAAVLRADGTAGLLGSGGTLLGITPDIEVQTQSLLLAPGEQLVLYTDGVTERRDGPRWFGEHHLLEVLRASAGRTPDGVAGRLEQAVRDFARDDSRDDLAVLVVGAPAPARVSVVGPRPSVTPCRSTA